MSPLTIALISTTAIVATISVLLCFDYGISDFYGGGGCPKQPPRI